MPETLPLTEPVVPVREDWMANFSRAIDQGLTKFLDERSQARKFHRSTIGQDVEPHKCWSDWLCTMVRVHNRHEAADAQRHIEKNYPTAYRASEAKTALSVSAGGLTGGYVVPVEIQYSLMQDVAEESFIRPQAFVQPMASATLLLPLPDAISVVAAGTPPFFGGFSMKWTQEATTESEAEPMMREVELRAQDLAGYCVTSNPMLQDGGAPLESYLRKMFARAVGWFEDYAFLRGNGVGQPLGLQNGGGAIVQARNTPNLFKYADAQNMLLNLLPYSFVKASWLISVSAVGQLVGLTGWVPNTDFGGSRPTDGPSLRSMGSLFNRPVFVSEKLPALGTKGDVTLYDPSLYVIGDRQAVQIDFSPHFSQAGFLKNQSAWRIIERVDGRPWFDQKILLQDAATQVSPYVLLAT